MKARLRAFAAAVRARLFRLRGASALSRRSHVLCLGDSHSQVFWHWNPPRMWVLPVLVWGATASGIRNPNSSTDALSTYQQALAHARPWQHVMVMLGEVDCGYIMWRRAREKGLSIEQQLDTTLDRYAAFLHDIALRRPASVMVMSVPLPALPDDASDWGEIAQRRADTPVSQRDRTDLTLRFNDRLRALCAAEGYRYVDATSGQLDPESRLLRTRFVRDDGDHHLRDDAYRGEIAAALAAGS